MACLIGFIAPLALIYLSFVWVQKGLVHRKSGDTSQQEAIADEQVVSSDDASSEVNFGNNLRSDVALKMQQGSTADELLKWKDLLDKGAITQEEYDVAKRDLLS